MASVRPQTAVTTERAPRIGAAPTSPRVTLAARVLAPPVAEPTVSPCAGIDAVVPTSEALLGARGRPDTGAVPPSDAPSRGVPPMEL